MPSVYKTNSLVGTIEAIPIPPNQPPAGYLPCDGALLLIANYPVLFSVIGTRHGGNGTTNFRVPDYRGMFLRGASEGRAVPEDNLRTAMAAGGVSGSQVGSVQGHAFRTHTHTIGQVLAGYQGQSPADDRGAIFSAPGILTGLATATGALSQASNTETRPINAYVTFFIRY